MPPSEEVRVLRLKVKSQEMSPAMMRVTSLDKEARENIVKCQPMTPESGLATNNLIVILEPSMLAFPSRYMHLTNFSQLNSNLGNYSVS
jgi:hypothetical protein